MNKCSLFLELKSFCSDVVHCVSKYENPMTMFIKVKTSIWQNSTCIHVKWKPLKIRSLWIFCNLTKQSLHPAHGEALEKVLLRPETTPSRARLPITFVNVVLGV